MAFDDYSTRFLSELSRAFPDVADRAAAGPEEGCFTVEIPTASGSAIRVWTEDIGRITAGWDDGHVHFGGWADSDDAKDFAEALAYLNKLIRNEPKGET